MLSTLAERATPFSRGDAVRLAVFACFLVAAMTVILAADIVPRGLGLQVGQVAPDDIRAPRQLDVVSQVATDQARQAARDSVPFKYDYTPERAATIADQQGAAFSRSVAAADAAFQASLKPAARQELLKSVLPNLGGDVRGTFLALTPDSWKTVRSEAARPLGGRRSEARRLGAAGGRVRVPAPRVGLALPPVALASRQRAAAGRSDPGRGDLRIEAHRWTLDPGFLRSDRRGRHADRDPPRPRSRNGRHGRAGAHRWRGERWIDRDGNLHL